MPILLEQVNIKPNTAYSADFRIASQLHKYVLFCLLLDFDTLNCAPV